MSYERELEIALQGVAKAVRLCRRVRASLAASDAAQKDDRSPVTVADLGTQAVLTLDLLAAFPGDSLVAEEESELLRREAEIRTRVLRSVAEEVAISGEEALEDAVLGALDHGSRPHDPSGRFWTLDPIDGTKGFLRGEQYAIALALIEAGEVKLGVLGCPNYSLGEDPKASPGALFYAVRGQGAFERLPEGGEPRAISTDGIADGARARLCESVEKAHADHGAHARISEALGIVQPPYRIDSQAKYAAVARGDASVYLRRPRTTTYREKIWDHAAGTIVVEEAGGRVTDFSGEPLRFTEGQKLEKNIGVVATNGPIHERVLEAIAAERTGG